MSNNNQDADGMPQLRLLLSVNSDEWLSSFVEHSHYYRARDSLAWLGMHAYGLSMVIQSKHSDSSLDTVTDPCAAGMAPSPPIHSSLPLPAIDAM